MRCEVERFEVSAMKHPTDADGEAACWKVFIKVRFKSNDRKDWGELRAYGGSWKRTLNRSHGPLDFLAGVADRDPTLKHNPRKHESSTQIVTNKSEYGAALPPWGHAQGPPKIDKKDWHLANDQHIEIIYREIVPGVPRSNPHSRHKLADDNNSPDNLKSVMNPEDFDMAVWHVVGRDEPTTSGFQIGDYVEYWHQAEFQIRVPRTTKIMERRRVLLKVNGHYPDYQYHVFRV